MDRATGHDAPAMHALTHANAKRTHTQTDRFHPQTTITAMYTYKHTYTRKQQLHSSVAEYELNRFFPSLGLVGNLM